MTTRRRSGPSPALVLLISAVATVAVFLGILALQVPAGTPVADYPAQIVAQLQVVWASFFPPVATKEITVSRAKVAKLEMGER